MRLKVVPNQGNAAEQCTTWLQLFVLFSLMGGQASQPVKAHLRQSHDRLFKAFRKGSKQLFRFAKADTRPLLKAAVHRDGSTAGVWPLGAYGFHARLPSLSFTLALGQQGTAYGLHASLCSYGAKVPSTVRCLLQQQGKARKAVDTNVGDRPGRGGGDRPYGGQ